MMLRRRGGLSESTLGKESYAMLQSRIRCSQLTVRWIGGGFLRFNNLFTKKKKNNRSQSYVKILIISKITFIFDTKIKMLTPLVQFPTMTVKTATNSGSETAFRFWWEVRVVDADQQCLCSSQWCNSTRMAGTGSFTKHWRAL